MPNLKKAAVSVTSAGIKRARDFLAWSEERLRPDLQDESLGLDHVPGDHHYRSFVGPPQDYDIVGGLQFSLLFAAGMRDEHRVLDVGCGSLRAGRLLIPYLRRGHYAGLEPNEWLVREGIQRELGYDLVRRKRPRFSSRSDFDASEFGVQFDFMMAQSIFSHTFEDLAMRGLSNLARSLSQSGMMFATFGIGSHPDGVDPARGSGWLYPGCVSYEESDVRAMASTAGLACHRIDWFHPWQTWFVFGNHEADAELSALAANLRQPWTGGSSPFQF